MEKEFLTAANMLEIAAQHAYCAEHLLKKNAEVLTDENISVDALLPVTTLIHMAFELTLKAYLLHESRPIKHYKNLLELAELNANLGLSQHELTLINTLTRQHAYHKSAYYLLWEDRQQMQGFCADILTLYARLQEMMPVELQSDYLN